MKVQKSKEVNPWFYKDVHDWIRKNYGKADHCENPNCKGIDKKGNKIKTFQWALIHGKTYDFKRENFKQLCASCHCKYDTPIHTKEWNKKVSKSLTGRPLSEEHKSKVSRPEHWTQERKDKISKAINKYWENNTSKLKGIPLSLEHKKAVSEGVKKSMTPEVRAKISEKTKEGMKNLPRVICPHCGKIGAKYAMKQWHFDNCKKIKL